MSDRRVLGQLADLGRSQVEPLGLAVKHVTVFCAGCWSGQHGTCERPCRCTDAAHGRARGIARRVRGVRHGR